MNIQQVKQRFEIIGNSPKLNRALEVAIQVAPTDISVLVTGESGTGKEIIPQVIHQLSQRKHGNYVAVNCGAIPEGTIDSELLVTKKVLLLEQQEVEKGILRKLMEERFSWMKWLNYLNKLRCVYYVFLKQESLCV